jgi:hypothetical protein
MSGGAGRRSAGRAAALAVGLAVAGCAAPRSPLPDVDTSLAGLQAAYTPAKVTECLATPLASQRPCRDAVAQSLLVAIDLRYAEFELQFFDANRAAGFGSSVALLGLGAAGSLAGNGTAQVLSAISAFVTGTRESFGREILVEQTMPALLTAMRTQRNMVSLRIRDGLSLDAERYPLGVALSDLYAYFRAGTVPGAVVGVTQAVGAQGQLTQDELRRAVPVAQDAAARCLQGMLSSRITPVLATRQANRERMREAMNEARVPANVRPDEFAFDTGPAVAAQQRAVALQLRCAF